MTRAAADTTPLGWGLLLVRIGLAAVFLVAALPKIAAPDLFAISVSNYKILPPWGVNAVALVLPWLELLVGTCLALGIWRRASALVVSALMLVFMAGYVSARARGLDIACGCFEVGEGAPASPAWRVVARDLALLAASVLLVRFDRGPRPSDWVRRDRRAA